MAEVQKIEKKEDKPKRTITDVVSNIYREATEYDMGKVLTIAKSVVSTLQANPKLNKIAKSNIGSLVNCVRQAISLGLPIDANQYCYLIPYKCKADNWKEKLTLQVGYKGFIYKILKAYPNIKIEAKIVMEGDEIEVYKKDNNDYINHKYIDPLNLKNLNREEKIKKVKGAYCILTFPNGKTIIEIIDREQIDLIKSKSKTIDNRKNKYNGEIELSVWQEWFCEMCKKSVIRRACKIHFSAEVVDLNEFDNKMYDITPKKPNKTAGLEEANENLENE